MNDVPAIEFELTLRDGASVHLRPVVPEDREALQAGLQSLSVASRYRRFMAVRSRFTRRELTWLTEIDYHDHFAWAAVDLSGPAPVGLGIGRYIRLADERDVAEVAVTIADAHQGRGLGTLLLCLVLHTARAHGVRVIRGHVLASNTPMNEIFLQLGAQRAGAEGGTVIWEIDPSAAPPDTPAGRVSREVGAAATPALLARRP